MRILPPAIVAAVLSVLLSASTGCKDKRIDRAPEPGREVTVEAPGTEVHIDRQPAIPVTPRPAEGVDVNVGPGGVQVDVEGTPLRDRLREKRAQAQP